MAAAAPVWAVAGLGNPGPSYADTRHNAGYWVVEELARRWSASWARHRRAHADAATAHILAGTPEHCRVTLVRPRSYMNESGGPVRAVMDFERIPPDRLIVVHDELDLPVAGLRVKFGGGDNGHNGLRSLRKSLGTGDFYRVRFGVGRPPGRQDPAAFVLSPMRGAERKEAAVCVQECADAVESLIARGLQATQNEFNR